MNLEASWQYSGYQHVGCNDKTALATILFFFLKVWSEFSSRQLGSYVNIYRVHSLTNFHPTLSLV